MTVIDARARFAGIEHRCRDCDQPGVAIVFPHVDHRRRKPWPQPYWLCAEHSAT